MKNKIKYSKIIAGTMTWGRWGKRFPLAQMVKMIHGCVDLGITTFDHADIYGDYTTEAEFGKAFSSSKTKRDKIQLITKCGIQFDTKERPNKVKHYNYSKDYILWSVDRSLQNLQTDYIDLLLLHRPSPLLSPAEIGEAVDSLKNTGKIRDFGVSNFTPSQIALLETVLPVSGNQMEYSLTANEVQYNGILDDCIVGKRIAMSWSPLGSYFKENTPKTQRIQRVLEPLTEKYDATEDQLLLAWILRHPANIHPVVGTANESRLKKSVDALKIQMELEDWFLLLEASKGSEVP
ncbi:aldo/keto reductase [Flavobacteriaceae bacterium TP-CH-4]|uniref:Aldo/keto reductase n=1 Tax=Pelagihabitans pacificus TaxID=2696054 RepID=A0A967ED16_9FLAO|nr:aldo/keto reductase [Pelagihabitans pacificus]NHF58863.1 aldo/keto reductase [Pelagihabitans pacificus]